MTRTNNVLVSIKVSVLYRVTVTININEIIILDYML